MAIQKTEKIWHNGNLIPWDKRHPARDVARSSLWLIRVRGVRCYALPSGPAIFRAKEHMQRLLDSAKIYRIDVDFTVEELVAGMAEVVKNNGVWPCYIRPIVLRGYGEAGVNPFNSPTEVYICNYPWGKYLGTDADEGRRRLRLLLDPDRPEHLAGDGQVSRELHELAAHQDGSHHQRLCRRHRARCQWLCERRLGRECLRGTQRRAEYRAAGKFCAAWHYARLGVANCARPGYPRGRAGHSTRTALYCG